ncbi:LOW QUALITY PROTEIN: gap junction protein alpha 4 [Centropristis striata]|uniref:LOW QUALITY PROTEIN: gap junction protein alpha 4 n=1 Tax=Centropristis striata TaxID=184440 RepID=UPI0027E0D3B1|nr:LOW QUALITY PROTEIN: gap junction protein alpha 4 [Centropristis striata]
MSRADWSFLENLLEEGQEYSTGIGRVWLTVLFLFRILVLGTAAESAWDDEQVDFVCNTQQPGCPAVCYDKAFPISHFRYFVLQVIFVSTPTIFYFGYVAIRAGRDKKTEEDEKELEEGGGDNSNAAKDNAAEKEKQEDAGRGRKAEKPSLEAPKLKGRLLCAYAFSILVKVLLEVGFILGLWFLYDGFFIAAKFECTATPCPHTVDCFVSRPTEKTIFTIYTQVIAAISLLLNLVELLHLLQLAISHRLEKRYQAVRQDYLPRSERVPARPEVIELQTDVPQSYKAGSHVGVPMQVEASCYPNPCESYGDLAIEVNWGTEENGNDLLPSYVNCMGAMKTTHPHRVHYKNHTQHTGKTPKVTRKGHLKQKHYV